MNRPKSIETTTKADRVNSLRTDEAIFLIWGSRKLIGIITATVAVLSVIISLLLPEYFRSTATLLPEADKGKLAALGGLSDLATIAGITIPGEASLAKLYPVIVKSEAILTPVILARRQTKKFEKPVNLIEFWKIDEKTREREYETALKELRDELEVTFDNKTSIVTISLLTTEPQLSAEIVNHITNELDQFIRTKRTTNATERRDTVLS